MRSTRWTPWSSGEARSESPPSPVPCYSLVKRNLRSGFRDPLGVTAELIKYFSTVERAKLYAQSDYAEVRGYGAARGKDRSIAWGTDPTRPRTITSGDLGNVLYDITPIVLES